MRIWIFAAAMALPLAVSAADRKVLDVLPGLNAAEPAAEKKGVQRPDAQKIMGELSATLKLSTRQEDRIAKAVNRKTREFDEAMEEYEKNSREEKKWREKMEKNAAEMERIAAELPDTVKEYLDDEQKESYDNLLASRNKPARAEEALEPAAQPAAPVRKKRLVRRKKGAAAPAAEPAAAPAEEDAGGVMVDKEPPPRKKRLVRRKKAAPAPESEPEPAAGAAPTGKSAPAQEEEDAGSYP